MPAKVRLTQRQVDAYMEKQGVKPVPLQKVKNAPPQPAGGAESREKARGREIPQRREIDTHRQKASLQAKFDNAPVIGTYACCIPYEGMRGIVWQIDSGGMPAEVRFYLRDDEFLDYFEEV